MGRSRLELGVEMGFVFEEVFIFIGFRKGIRVRFRLECKWLVFFLRVDFMGLGDENLGRGRFRYLGLVVFFLFGLIVGLGGLRGERGDVSLLNLF